MGIVADQFKVVEIVFENAASPILDFQIGRRARCSLELRSGLLKVIVIKMNVAERVHKISQLQPCRFGHHRGQQRIRSDVEWHAQKEIRTALIQLAA